MGRGIQIRGSRSAQNLDLLSSIPRKLCPMSRRRVASLFLIKAKVRPLLLNVQVYI
jgi:hypothetical protein